MEDRPLTIVEYYNEYNRVYQTLLNVFSSLIKKEEMKEENKYYTPTIEELYVGFECEFTSVSCAFKCEISDDIRYGPLYSSGIVSIIDWEKSEDLDTIIRVKYLDKEDIESLGWEFEKTNKIRYWYIRDFSKSYGNIPMSPSHRFWEFKLNHDPEYNCVQIDAKTDSGDWEKFYEGVCKNKSELKLLMKQVGIKLGTE